MTENKAFIGHEFVGEAKQSREVAIKGTKLVASTVNADNSTLCLKIYTQQFRRQIAVRTTIVAVVAAAAGCMLGYDLPAMRTA
jgi:hypothetical protein